MGKRKIIWSPKATNKLLDILEFYKHRNKSKNYSLKLYKKINDEVAILKKQPEIGIKTEIESVRGLIILDFILFYEYNQEQIIIHTLWDSRQDPVNLKIK
jgi:plasmid stabilization system protein ParE